MGLESVELVLAWESEFDISIPNKVAATLETPRDVGNYIERALESGGRGMSRLEVDRIVKTVVIEMLGLPEREYGVDVKFIEQMGVD